jgi:two-component system, cell cycle sensor histidine kinase and response regulator CckA
MQLATRDDQIEQSARTRENDEFCENRDIRKSASRLPDNDSTQSRDDLQIVARATNDAVRDWDVRSGRLIWPQGLETLLGYCRSSLTEEIAFWNQNIQPEDLARIVPSIADALAGNGEHWSDEYRFRRADGTYIVLLERALIVRDAAGRAVRFVGSLMDVTARKQLQDQLCRSQRMEAFGQLAAGVAHDFNNFLTTILGYSDLVLAEAHRKSTIAEHIAEIRGAAGRASGLTGQLLAFSRKQALEPRVVEVNSLILNLERSLLRLLGDNIRVVCHLHDENNPAHIKVDPGQFNQIIVNIAVNARDAMPRGGQLTIATNIVDLSAETEPAFFCGDFGHGQYVLISFTDNGQGMTDEVKAHLFEPFFTTKEQGSGLGLATAYGIVHQSGGHIRVESESGKGTTVQVYLPRVPAPPPTSYKKPSAKKLPTGTESILVLEDDISVRHVSIRVLRSLGYEVIEAANGDDAQRLIQESAGRQIDLLLTDVVMPQMSGRFFADWLRKLRPRTKVVFVSGYLSETLHPGDRIDNGMFFLPKPFDPEQLAQTIRHALDA